MKSKSKRRKQRAVPSNNTLSEEVTAENDSFETQTLMSGDTKVPKSAKKKKGKGKKKKVSKSGKSLTTLERKVEKLKLDETGYSSFLSHIQKWLQENANITKEIFKLIDKEGDGLLTYDDFKAGMFDLKIPANKVELHLLCTLLDKNDTRQIDYREIENSLLYVRQIRDIEKQRFQDHQLVLANRQKRFPCPCCKMLIIEPNEDQDSRCVMLELRAVTFDMVNDYPGHFKLVVHTKLPVCGLIQMIIQETGISSTKLAIFNDKTRFAESVLSPSMTLEECGYLGDVKGCVEEFTLYYDYTVEFTDCPILMTDHYFGQKISEK